MLVLRFHRKATSQGGLNYEHHESLTLMMGHTYKARLGKEAEGGGAQGHSQLLGEFRTSLFTVSNTCTQT